MSVNKILLTGVFGTLIFVPFVCYFAFGGADNERVLTTENRTVTQYQKLKSFRKSDIKSYFSNLDQYISDRLLLKDEVVSSVNRFMTDRSCFTSVDYSKGVIGKNGFVFLGDKYEHVISRHFFENAKLANQNRSRLLSAQTAFYEAAKSVGADYFVFIAPDKHGVYCEQFPDWLNPTSCRITRNITDSIASKLKEKGIPVVYPLSELRDRKEDSVYYKTDTHWNNLGAEIGFYSLINHISETGNVFANRKFVKFTGYSLKKVPNHELGDLGAIVGLGKDFEVNDVDYEVATSLSVQWSVKNEPYAETPLNKARAATQNSKWFAHMKNPQAPNKQRVLVIGDSFMGAMSFFLNMTFSNIYYLTKYGTSTEETISFIKKVKPDLVINEMVERSMN